MSLPLETWIAYWSWPVLFFVWFLARFNTKETIARPRIKTYLGTTALLILGFTLLFSASHPLLSGSILIPPVLPIRILGDVLVIFGIGFAIWARIVLGRNWSGTIATLKKDHVLVQFGPYEYVRHPIYTGFFFAMLGTALTIGTLEAYFGVLFGLIAFLIRIPLEERIMMRQFPDQYRRYRQQVKAFLPIIW